MKHIKITGKSSKKAYYSRHGIIDFEGGLVKIPKDDYVINEGKEAIQYLYAVDSLTEEGWIYQGKHSYIVFKK